MSDMRAKMKITEVKVLEQAEILSFTAVCGKSNAEGFSEDNTYAKYSPSGSVTLTVANEALRGKFKPGKTYYVDFTEVPEAAPVA